MKTEFVRPLRPECIVSPREKILNDIRNVIGFYQEQGIDARLIGSLGRQASLNTKKPDFLRNDGSERDIDILLVNPRDNTPKIIARAKRIVKHDTLVNVFLPVNEALFIRYKNIFIEVDPKITQLRIGHLAEIPIPTLDPNLLFHLSALYLLIRSKDKASLHQYAKELRNIDHLPDQLFEPFHTLIDLRQQQYPLDRVIAKLEYLYLRNTPIPLQNVLQPILSPIHNTYMSAYKRDNAEMIR